MKRLLLSVVVLCWIACKTDDKNNETVEAVILEPVEFDSTRDVLSEIRKYEPIPLDSAFAFTCKQLSIPDIRKNPSAEQIRLWIKMSGIDSGRVLTFAERNGKWTAEFVSYGFWNTIKYRRTVIRRRTDDSGPMRGWDNFLRKIETLGIYQLNDSVKNHCNDANVVIIEWTHNSLHRRFLYYCPDMGQSIPYLDKVHAILKEIEKQFAFQVYPLDWNPQELFPQLHRGNDAPDRIVPTEIQTKEIDSIR